MPSPKPKDPEVIDIDLVLEKDTRQGFNLMRLAQGITISTDDLIVLMPGAKGHGWRLRVHKNAPRQN